MENPISGEKSDEEEAEGEAEGEEEGKEGAKDASALWGLVAAEEGTWRSSLSACCSLIFFCTPL